MNACTKKQEIFKKRNFMVAIHINENFPGRIWKAFKAKR